MANTGQRAARVEPVSGTGDRCSMRNSESEVRLHGRRYPILRRFRIAGRTFLAIEQLGHFARPTYRVVEIGLTREVRYLQVLPFSKQNLARLRLLSKVSQPNVNLPSIVTSQRSGNEIHLVTNWIDGPRLEDYLRDCHKAREPWPSVLITMNLFRGLSHGFRLLHDRLGVVHGDVHPGNLILCRHTKRLVPIDFGNAWNAEVSARRNLDAGAARAYAAPEVLAKEGNASFQADQFSAMTVCYEMLTGEIPYGGLGGRIALANEEEQQRVVLKPPSESLRHASGLPAAIGGELDALFQRSLAIKSEARFDSAHDWIVAMDRLASKLAAKPHNISRVNSWLLASIEKISSLWGRG